MILTSRQRAAEERAIAKEIAEIRRSKHATLVEDMTPAQLKARENRLIVRHVEPSAKRPVWPFTGE